MKAIRIHDFGGPDVLAYEDAPMPEPTEGEVLVKVYAAGINPADWKTRQSGGFIKQSGAQMPVILGWDMSGVIESVGPGVTAFTSGQSVYGMVRFPNMGNAYAEYLTTPISDIALKPEKIDHVHAAGVPLAGLTAWQALFEVAALEAGQRILVQAAAGGVGHLAVQLAKWKGAYVIGTASAQNSDFLRQIGADEVIDYNAVLFEDVLHDVDVVFNAVNPEIATRSLKVLKHGGMLVSIAGLPSSEALAEYDVRAQGMLVRPESTQLTELAKLIDEGKVRPYVESVFPLTEAAKAHELGEQGHTRGKIVLKVRD
jgi:NADPH:quinone reductase-like Zn-dependent oxidoreductase